MAVTTNQWLMAGGGVGLVIVVIWIVSRRRGGRRSQRLGPPAELILDVTQLRLGPVPRQGRRLEFYGTPVRLAVLVLAPAGRGTKIPPASELRHVVDQLIPGFASVLDIHQPVYRRWPEQLSTQGFASTFFNAIKLPGNAGKGSPWCSVAGRFDIGGGHLLVGCVCKADRDNSLGQVIVQHEGLWHDVLRVRSD